MINSIMIFKPSIRGLTALFVVVGFFLSHCRQDKEENLSGKEPETLTIDLSNARPILLSELVTGVDYVSFDVEDPLGFGNVLIKNSKIYYHDLQNIAIYLFDLNGNLLNKIDSYGEGPQEYLSIGNFVVLEDGSLIIYDFQLQKRLYFDSNFEFQKEVVMDLSIPYQQIVEVDNDNYLMSTNHNTKVIDGQLTNCEYVLTDSSGRPLKKFFDKLYPDEDESSYISYMPFPMQMITDDQGNIYGNVNYDNSLYVFDEDEFTKFLTVQYKNGETINYDKMLQLSKMDQMLYFTRSDDFIGKVSAPNFEVYNDDLVLVNYFKRATSGVGISLRNYISFRNGSDFHAEEIMNDLTGFPERVSLSYGGIGYYYLSPWYNENFVALVYPNEILKAEETATLPDGTSISAEDNPMLLIMPVRKDLL